MFGTITMNPNSPIAITRDAHKSHPSDRLKVMSIAKDSLDLFHSEGREKWWGDISSWWPFLKITAQKTADPAALSNWMTTLFIIERKKVTNGAQRENEMPWTDDVV